VLLGALSRSRERNHGEKIFYQSFRFVIFPIKQF